MPKASAEQVRRETELIRSLHYEKGLSEEQVTLQLGIDRATFYRYLNRIHKENAKLWKPLQDSNIIKSRYVQFQKILEDGLAFNLKQMNDERLDARERREASIVAATFSAHLLKLAESGPSFHMLPEVKARVVLENKQL